MLEVEKTAIDGVLIITPKRLVDERGFFVASYNAALLKEKTGIADDFVQDNHSKSVKVGTIRGLHYQAPPRAQSKLVRVLRGAITDVAVDVRNGSPTYGKHVSVKLSAENGKQLYVPVGFLHGIAALEPDTAIAYKCSDYYSQPHDGSVFFADPDLGIDWGIDPAAAVLSEKDKKAVAFRDFKSPF
jgi:dTDP-4-dehydrorhamnose 3,5-epimerase